MPTYSYKCPKCQHTFEGTAKMSDPNPPCPNTIEVPFPPPTRGMQLEPCGTQVQKDFNWGGAPAVHFLGGGWSNDQ